MPQKPPSQRQLKVGEMIRHALSDIFMKQDFYDEESHTEIQITISEVRVSPNLRNATVYAMPLGGKDKEATETLLNAIAPKIRHMLAKKIHLKYLPELQFRLDTSFDNASRLEDLLNNPHVKQDLNPSSSSSS